MREKARSLSFSSSVSLPVMPIDSTSPAAINPIMTTTIIISMSVKPRWALFRLIPVSDVRRRAFAARLVVRAEGEEVVLAAMRARIHVLIFVAPGVLADLLGEVAARAPVADRRVGRLGRQR